MKKISGKTISIKCDKNREQIKYQKYRNEDVDPQGTTYLVHQGKVLNDKKTIEENTV